MIRVEMKNTKTIESKRCLDLITYLDDKILNYGTSNCYQI